MSSLLLEVKNVIKFLGSNKVLKGISFDLKAGEIFGLLGPNGAGKTTLFSLISTLRPPSSGDVLFKGKSIYQNDNLIDYRKRIGVCPQRPNLNKDLTNEENLVYAGRYFGLSNVEIQNNLARLTESLQLREYLGAKPETLSGGYKQRFLIARSLMHNPELLILDEPTVGLDPHIRHQLWDFISQIKKDGICVLLITHYLDEAEILADRVCIMDKGEIKLIDTPKNLLLEYQKSRLEDVFLAIMEQGKD